MSEFATVSEGEDWSDDGPNDGEHIGGDMDVGLEDGHPGIIHCIKQTGQSMPHREDGEDIPDNIHNIILTLEQGCYLMMEGTLNMT